MLYRTDNRTGRRARVSSSQYADQSTVAAVNEDAIAYSIYCVQYLSSIENSQMDLAFVFIHGGGLDPWVWERLTPLLELLVTPLSRSLAPTQPVGVPLPLRKI